ncbi:hypothetical protein HKD37_01G001425 [Glycine soja]
MCGEKVASAQDFGWLSKGGDHFKSWARMDILTLGQGLCQPSVSKTCSFINSRIHPSPFWAFGKIFTAFTLQVVRMRAHTAYLRQITKQTEKNAMMTTKTITESSNVNHKKVWRPWSCGSAPSQETEQVSHILIHTGFIYLTGGFCRLLPCLGIGPVSRPCNLSPKLLWGRAYKRARTLPLLTEAEQVETLMYLHLSMVVGRLLANQML